MSLLPLYREREEQIPTGEAGSMKKSKLLVSLNFSLDSIPQPNSHMYERS